MNTYYIFYDGKNNPVCSIKAVKIETTPTGTELFGKDSMGLYELIAFIPSSHVVMKGQNIAKQLIDEKSN